MKVAWLGVLGAFSFSVGVVLAQGQRMAGPGPTVGPASATAIIFGQVVDGSSGQPVSDATVALSLASGSGRSSSGRAASAVPRAMASAMGGFGAPEVTRQITDSQGHFVFHDLPAGVFQLTVTAPGYLLGTFGQFQPSGPSRMLNLTDGERLADAKVLLWQPAVLSGTVLDELGEPAVGVTVWALRRSTVNGQARLNRSGGGVTDDRGMFRIAALVPGSYVVAIPETQVTQPVEVVQAAMDGIMTGRGSMVDFVGGTLTPSPDGQRIGSNLLRTTGDKHAGAVVDHGRIGAYLTEYYPGATTPAEAQAITLESGEDRSNLSFQLRVASTVTVAGTVVGPDGPAAGATVTLTSSATDEAGIDAGFETASTLTRADGSFTFLAVPLGQYTARATKMTGQVVMPAGAVGVGALVLNQRTSGPGRGGVPLYGRAPVVLSGADSTGVAIQLREGARLSGRVEFVGATTPPTPAELQSIWIAVSPTSGRAGGGPGPVVDQNGQFKTQSAPPGRSVLTVMNPLGLWTLKSVVINGQDVLGTVFDWSTTDVEGAVVTFADKVNQITGTVRGIAANTGATVIVFPADYKARVASGISSARLRQTSPSPAGAYAVANLPAGDYLATAIDDVDASDNLDEAFLDALARVATRISLGTADKKTVDLVVTRIK